MKILVIRFSSIGDIVLTTPVVRCLKQQLPDAQIHYLTKTGFGSMLSANPYIDRLHLFSGEIADIIDELKQEQFDYIIDLHNNIRTTRIKSSLKVKSFSFPKLNIRKWVYVNLKLDIMPDISIVERYFETVKPLGVRNDGKGLDYFIPESAEITHQDIPMSHWGGYVGCVIGGSYKTKQLPAEKWKELILKIPIPVMLLGGKEDVALGQTIASLDPIKVYNACGKFDLNESADLVKRAKLVISNDTGLMHVAAAFGKPVVSLWGNTTPQMGMFPYYGFNNLNSVVDQRLFILENKNLSCRPCSKIGYNKCPRGHFKCMNQLNFSGIEIFLKKYI